MNSYTYLVGWSALGRYYYGCQFNRRANPDDLWKTYFTSSKHVKALREEYGEPDVIQVRKTFGDDAASCRDWETRVLIRLLKSSNVKWINRRVTGDKWFPHAGWKHTEEFKEKRSEEMSGVKKTLTHRFNISKSKRGIAKPKTLAAGLRLLNVGYVVAKDVETGEVIRVQKDEFDKSDRFVGVNAGRKHSDESKKKMAESVTGKGHDAEWRQKVSNSKTGYVIARHRDTGVLVKVTKEEFRTRPELKGVGGRKPKQTGS